MLSTTYFIFMLLITDRVKQLTLTSKIFIWRYLNITFLSEILPSVLRL